MTKAEAAKVVQDIKRCLLTCLTKEKRMALDMATEELSKKPFNPFEDNIDEGSYWCGFTAGQRAATQWIPCSEKLPDNQSYVLTTISIPSRQLHARSGWYQDGFFYNDNGDTWNDTDPEVKAWMPLPEPWNGDL